MGEDVWCRQGNYIVFCLADIYVNVGYLGGIQATQGQAFYLTKHAYPQLEKTIFGHLMLYVFQNKTEWDAKKNSLAVALKGSFHFAILDVANFNSGWGGPRLCFFLLEVSQPTAYLNHIRRGVEISV